MLRKTIVLSFPSEEAKEEFVNTFLEKASLHKIVMKGKGQKLYITIFGTHDEIKMVQALIKEITKSILTKEATEKGLRVYGTRDIIRLINRTVSLETLHIVLKERGYISEYDAKDNIIRTNALEETVKSLAERIVYAVDQLRFRTTSTSVKRYLSSLYAITGVNLDTIIDLSIRLNLVKEENNKLYMNKEWRSAIKEYLKYIRTSQEIYTPHYQ